MDWNTPTMWWLATGALVAAELATGTFYLLMLALGCAAGAVAAHAGLSGTTQVASAALLGLAATAAWHLHRLRQPPAPPSGSNRDVNLDIGSPVRVEQWQADGSARVPYRGSAWSARFAGNGTPRPGEHVIVGVQGSELRVAPANT
jgi:membrane protein implicated in regulation of membrane protease activity